MKKTLSMTNPSDCSNNPLVVCAEDAGRRLDNFILSKIKAPKSLINKLIRKGAVRVNGRRAKHDSRLACEDVVKVPRIEQAHTGPSKCDVSDGLLSAIREAIIYEDDDLVVINKPAGLASQLGSNIPVSAVDVMRRLYPQHPSINLAHRLDRQTSGCLIFAKNKPALITLQKAFVDRAVQKTYLAILDNPDDRTIMESVNQPIKIVMGKNHHRIAVIDQAGKPALTAFKSLAKVSGLHFVVAMPKTGRMHQIRVHAVSMGAAIKGDSKYSIRLKDESKRLFLHSYSVMFKHPFSSSFIDVLAPVPGVFAETLGMSALEMEHCLAGI